MASPLSFDEGKDGTSEADDSPGERTLTVFLVELG